MPHRPDENAQTPKRARRGYDSSSSAPDYEPHRVVGSGGTYGAVTGSSQAAISSRSGRRVRTSGSSATGQRSGPRFRGAIVRTVATTIVPGLGLIGTRAHRLGLLIIGTLLLGTAVVAITVLRNPALTAGSALQAGRVFTIGVVLAALGLLWVTIILGTYLISRPRKLNQAQRTIGATVVGVLALLVSVPMAVASAYAFETAALSGELFQSQDRSKSGTRPTLDTRDPWADKPRVNLLLLGGDSGEGRDTALGVRTDTMMLASIDTSTGATLIVQLPRNLQNPPFPVSSPLYEYFPWGFDNGSDSLLNAVWQDVPTMHPELFTETDYPGADALKWAVEGVTDLKVDYYVMVNMDGLIQLVDAMGGVVVNVNFPIAIGGSTDTWDCGKDGWIPEGPSQTLNGWEAMWYARSRCNTPGADYGRMQRQSCLVDAIIDQADPTTMATRYEGIAKAAGDMVETDIPQEHISAMVDLANRVQQGKTVERIAFTEETPGFNPAAPDFELMQSYIAEALAKQAAAATAEPDDPPTTSAPDEPDPTSEPGGEPVPPPTTEAPYPGYPGEEPLPGEPTWATTTENPAEDVGDACAYQHQEPEGGWYIPETVPVYTPEPEDTTEPPR